MCLLLILLLCVPALHQQSIYWAGTHNNNINNVHTYIIISCIQLVAAAAATFNQPTSSWLVRIDPPTSSWAS